MAAAFAGCPRTLHSKGYFVAQIKKCQSMQQRSFSSIKRYITRHNAQCHRVRLSRSLQAVQFYSSKSTGTVDAEILAKAASDLSATNYVPPPLSLQTDKLEAPETLDISKSLNALGEETFESLGLGKLTKPTGVIQSLLEHLHVSLDLPWWQAIALCSVIIRLIIFPAYVIGRRNMQNLQNHMPEIEEMNEKIQRAMLKDNRYEENVWKTRLQEFRKARKISNLRVFLPQLFQIPIMISTFVGLRQMASLPVESMKTGGIYWFTDLTIPDPYFLLPVMSVTTLFTIFKVGAEGNVVTPMVKYIQYGMCSFSFIFMINFPSALCCYWVTSNSITLLQALMFSSRKVQTFLKIPEKVVHPEKPKQSITQAFEDLKYKYQEAKRISNTKSVESDLEFIHQHKLKMSGEGAVPKTYKYNPVKLKKKKAK